MPAPTKFTKPAKGRFEGPRPSKPFSLFLVCFLLSSLDALSTLLALTIGKGYERNVVLALLLSHLGYPALLLWMPVEALALFVATALYRRFRTWLLSRWMRRHGSRRRQLLLGKLSERYEWARRLASRIDVEEVKKMERKLLETPLEYVILVALLVIILNNFMVVLR